MRGLKLFLLLVRDVQTIVVDLYARCIVSVIRNEFKKLTRFSHKLFCALVWVLCKLFPDVAQTEFRHRITSCIVYDVVMSQRYSLMYTYALDVCCFLLQSSASDGLSRRLHHNLYESVHQLCEKTSFASA